jgi:hypothetical protein
VGIPTRLASGFPESVLYRVTGIVDGTTLSWTPSVPAGAPTSIGANEAVEFHTRNTFVVQSQDDDHPFSLTQYMSGYIDDGIAACYNPQGDSDEICYLGDGEWINLVPPQQFLQSYAFFTDPTYGATLLSFIRAKATGGTFAEVELTCLGTVGGWEAVGEGDQYQVAHLYLHQAGVGLTPQCETSQHFAQSDQPFGLIVWGADWCTSYGYAAGGSLKNINDVM